MKQDRVNFLQENKPSMEYVYIYIYESEADKYSHVICAWINRACIKRSG